MKFLIIRKIFKFFSIERYLGHFHYIQKTVT